MTAYSALLFLVIITWLAGSVATTKFGNKTSCLPASCREITPTDASTLRKQFLDLKNLNEAYVIKFWIHYKQKLNGSDVTQNKDIVNIPHQNDSFNPLLWMWMSKYGTYAIDLPLDYKFVSLGLLSLKEYKIDIEVEVDNKCLSDVNPGCWNKAVFDFLGELIWPSERTRLLQYGEHMPQDYICRSAYAFCSFISSTENIAVGWKCCSYEDRMLGKCETGKIIKNISVSHQKTVFAFVIVLSVGLYAVWHGFARARLVWYAWKGRSWDWIGEYFGYGPTTYRTYILDIGPGDIKRWVHVSDEQLLQGENRVSMPELWQLFGGPLNSGRCIIIFRFIIVLVLYTAVAVIAIPKIYSDQQDTLKLLRSGEEVSLNLRSIPLAWWRTNSNFWPCDFGILLLIGVFVALILELILVLVFVIGFQRGPPKDFQHYLKDTPRKSAKKSKRKTNSSISVLLAILFLVLDVILGLIIIAAVIYPIVQVIVHVCLAVIIYIDFLTPWVIAVAMTLFHIHVNFNQFRQPYVDIKELLHAEFLNSQEAIQAYTIWNIHQNKSVRAFKSETVDTDENQKEKPVTPIPKLPPRMLRTLLVTFQQDRRPTILMEHFLKVSRHLVSNRQAVWGFIVRLLLFLTYLAVIMSSVTLYRASPGGGGDRSTEGLVTGAVVFVFLLLPHAYVAGKHRYKSSTCRLLWKLEIQRFMRSLETQWDGLFDSPEAKLRATFDRKKRREQWSIILEDDEVNPDPPLQFPDKLSENGTSEYPSNGIPRPLTMTPELTTDISSPPTSTTTSENWSRPISTTAVKSDNTNKDSRPISAPNPEVGSASTLADESRQQIGGSMSNMSNFSSTTT